MVEGKTLMQASLKHAGICVYEELVHIQNIGDCLAARGMISFLQHRACEWRLQALITVNTCRPVRFCWSSNVEAIADSHLYILGIELHCNSVSTAAKLDCADCILV